MLNIMCDSITTDDIGLIVLGVIVEKHLTTKRLIGPQI